ncbi:energy transducer TonB [Polaribacter septentrionalilitoris]|uniref:energy transducer TonB n=1 Tax=Polaribacter septentrionalilitoris TaxID=2494657 RepID=UPI001358E633|nr:energy transducer TonB [Polaribacter septentrionalilitoris]
METKKKPRQQLENFSKIFMQIGLVLSLFVTYALIEHKTYDRGELKSLGEVNMTDDMKEDIPIIKIQKIEPTQTVAPPPPSIEKIEIVDDKQVIEETIVETTETDEKEAITDVVITTDDIIEVQEAEEVVEDIPFVLIEDVPIYPGCKGNNKQLKDCFTASVTKYFGERFNTNLANELGLNAGKKRLFVIFRIDKTGKITNVKARGPHPLLEKEVSKIIKSLPKMTPGKQRGIPVGVSYGLPITFEVRE